MVKIQDDQNQQNQAYIKVENQVEETDKKNQNSLKKRTYKRSNITKNSKVGHWNQDERLKYIIFLEYHSNKFQNKELRRAWKIFKSMSDFIITRTPDQCRSHHQKMEKRYVDYKDIIQSHKIMIRPDIYQRTYTFYAENILDRLQASNYPSSLRFYKINQGPMNEEWMKLEMSRQLENNLQLLHFDQQQLKNQLLMKNPIFENELNSYYSYDSSKIGFMPVSLYARQKMNQIKGIDVDKKLIQEGKQKKWIDNYERQKIQ